MKVPYAILAVLPVVVAAARPPLPDLRPMVVVGSNTRITIRIANRGTAPAPAALVRVVLGAPINTAHNYPEPALAPGEIKSVTIPVGQPLAGVHYAVRVDGTGVIAESNEANNVATGNF
ncbi:MAG TPA: CARDB domain-containing protein [Longimicrobium sp.]|jgi:subtilase family serine protease|nr:CARDB domain-containing protein [Longimicrobium sp.]